MKRSIKILIVLPIFAVVVYFVIVFINSFIIPPPSEPLKFSIINKDNTTHNIYVEVVNEYRTVIFAEEYEINPSEKIVTPIITKTKGRYLIRVTMDGTIVKENYVSVASGHGAFSITILPKGRISIDQAVI